MGFGLLLPVFVYKILCFLLDTSFVSTGSIFVKHLLGFLVLGHTGKMLGSSCLGRFMVFLFAYDSPVFF